jgi:chromosome segregation ATPase
MTDLQIQAALHAAGLREKLLAEKLQAVQADRDRQGLWREQASAEISEAQRRVSQYQEKNASLENRLAIAQAQLEDAVREISRQAAGREKATAELAQARARADELRSRNSALEASVSALEFRLKASHDETRRLTEARGADRVAVDRALQALALSCRRMEQLKSELASVTQKHSVLSRQSHGLDQRDTLISAYLTSLDSILDIGTVPEVGEPRLLDPRQV